MATNSLCYAVKFPRPRTLRINPSSDKMLSARFTVAGDRL
jgi:hypothetical protein